MILAKSSGWLIGCKLISETNAHWVVKCWDEKRERKVPKQSTNSKLFDSVYEAQAWIDSIHGVKND